MNTARLANGVLALGLLLAILMLAACGETGGEDAGEEQETVVVTQPAEDAPEDESEPEGAGETAQEPQATGPEEDEGQAGGEAEEPAGGEAAAGQSPPVTAAGEPAELRDGVWTVGDAGEVEFALENGVLSLVDVRPATGWAVEIDEEAADEIEVEFEQNATE